MPQFTKLLVTYRSREVMEEYLITEYDRELTFPPIAKACAKRNIQLETEEKSISYIPSIFDDYYSRWADNPQPL